MGKYILTNILSQGKLNGRPGGKDSSAGSSLRGNLRKHLQGSGDMRKGREEADRSKMHCQPFTTLGNWRIVP